MPRRRLAKGALAAASARGSAASPPISVRDLRDDADVLGLQALGAASGVELDLLVLVERAESARREGAEVREDVGAAVVGGDEAEALVGVEPLDGSGCHVSFLL